ncbi:putative Heterokaryon incompatibility domain-containing protein [Seiridium unicorne]|uniref:Heterokaryon incompatibility domain-containing protein n=1 Tax=Seiridium unicorne TaxID=138068 RepID=A0ABR2URQ0_9PEZI
MPPIYAPLVSSQTQIRTIILHSGQFNEDIQCSFHIVSLDGNLEYEALSYVWGDPTITQPVIVDGNEMQVTTNLEAALRHLRSDQKPRTLWVDAICINQQDDREKSPQVPMMGKIFQQATSVLAWFGHGDEDIIIGISWFQYYILKQTNEHTFNWLAFEAGASIVEDARDSKLHILSVACDGLLKLLRHQYWSRMWTYQEFIVHQETPICVYGHLIFSLSALMEGFDSLQESFMGPYWDLPGLSEPLTLVWQTTGIRIIMWYSDTAAAFRLNTLAEDSKNKQKSLITRDLSGLLYDTVGRKASNPRDRIYALHGLYPDISEELPVDYSKPEKQVLLEAIAYMVRDGCSGFIWRCFPFHADRFFSRAFPSWSPDLDRVVGYLGKWTPLIDALQFSNSSIGADKISPDLTTFHLWSWNLGVCEVMERIDNSGVDDHFTMNAFKLGTFIAGLRAKENGSTPQRLSHRFARHAVASEQGHDQVSDNDLLDAFEAVSKDISLLTPEDGRFVSRAVELVKSSGFQFVDKAACIITSRGCVGFAPIDTEDNDLVVFPRKQHPMMVLRREFTDLSKSSQECYLMVGPAEVDAVTSSSYVIDSVVSKVKDYGIAEYLIH